MPRAPPKATTIAPGGRVGSAVRCGRASSSATASSDQVCPWQARVCVGTRAVAARASCASAVGACDASVIRVFPLHCGTSARTERTSPLNRPASGWVVPCGRAASSSAASDPPARSAGSAAWMVVNARSWRSSNRAASMSSAPPSGVSSRVRIRMWRGTNGRSASASAAASGGTWVAASTPGRGDQTAMSGPVTAAARSAASVSTMLPAGIAGPSGSGGVSGRSWRVCRRPIGCSAGSGTAPPGSGPEPVGPVNRIDGDPGAAGDTTVSVPVTTARSTASRASRAR